VLNEREIRAAAGILFALMFAAIAGAVLKNRFVLLKYAIAVFLPSMLVRVETITRKRGKSVTPKAIDGMDSQGDDLGYLAPWTREEPADGTIAVPRFLAIGSNWNGGMRETDARQARKNERTGSCHSHPAGGRVDLPVGEDPEVPLPRPARGWPVRPDRDSLSASPGAIRGWYRDRARALLLLATISVAIPSSKIPIMLSTASPGEQRVAEVRASRAR